MIRKTVDFRISGGFNTGDILDKYQGYKWVETTSPTTGRMMTCVSIDYYLIRVVEGVGKYAYLHVPCSDIINVIKRPFEE